MTRAKTMQNYNDKNFKRQLNRKNAEQTLVNKKTVDERVLSEVYINQFTDNIYLEEETDGSDGNSIVTNIFSPEDEQWIKSILASHYLFSHLDEILISMILDNFVEFKINKDDILFEEGDQGICFFIVRKGELDMIERGRFSKVILENECFGELSLLHTGPHTFTVKANKECSLFILEGQIYREIVKSNSSEEITEIVNFLDTIGLISCLSTLQKTNIGSLTVKCEFFDNQKIIKKGDDGDRMFIIKKGGVSCRNNGKEIKKMVQKEYFGEISLVYETKRTLDIVSVGNTVCYIITKSHLIEVLGSNYKNIILYSYFKFHILRNKFIMNLLSEIHLEDLYDLFEVKRYKLNEVVYNKDFTTNKKLTLIFQGCLINVKSFNIER